ncbi:hypothetical protein AMK09_25760 [Streptomyces sp. CB02488]|uniref:SUKH-4 family immunity protein n=1 Tax=unclassified Streptomyces TaxID=2593676 RepID=UPI00093E8551|nr:MULTISPECIES: SUKH-4 family immunity protein [unclassified Streptomyces]OKK15531.1 hypothetical protein AMK09_25760 [Streptomyces sp. CB02488]
MAERADRELIREIDALWASQLKAIPTGRIPHGVAPDVVEFLTSVGLPTVEAQGIAFVHDKRMSHLVERLDRRLLLIATDWEMPSFVADPESGRVHTFAGGRIPGLVLVGSSLPLFLVALGVWRRDIWDPTVVGMTAEDGLAAYERFETVLADLDPAAAEPDAYWPGLLDGLREGVEL